MNLILAPNQNRGRAIQRQYDVNWIVVSNENQVRGYAIDKTGIILVDANASLDLFECTKACYSAKPLVVIVP